MSTTFENIPASLRKPGRHFEFSAAAAARSLPANRQKLLLIGQRLGAVVTPVLAVADLDDLTQGGAFTGLAALHFLIEVDAASETDTFRWSTDGGDSWQAEDVAMTGAAQTLTGGVTVTFTATTGHSEGDSWEFWAYPAGTKAEETLQQILSDAAAATYFGHGSQAHLQARAALTANPYVALYAVALDDADGATPASGTLTITAGSVAGTFTVWIGNRSATITVASTDTATDIAKMLAQAINADPDFPAYAAFAAGVLTVTAKNAGTQGNNIALDWEAANACASAVVVDMASGATDPSGNDATDVVLPETFGVVATAWNDSTNVEKLETHLDFVSGPMEQCPGVGVFGHTGTLAAAAVLGAATNCERLVMAYLRDSKSLALEVAAAFAAVMAGEEDPAKPLNRLELKGVHAPDLASRFTRTEQESLLYSGVSPLEVNANGVPAIVRAITTYVSDSQGVPDTAFLDVTTIRTLDYLREACRVRVALRFPRAKNTAAIRASIRSELLDVLKRLEALEIVENVDLYMDGLAVEVNANDPNRADATIPADVVNGLMILAARIDLIL